MKRWKCAAYFPLLSLLKKFWFTCLIRKITSSSILNYSEIYHIIFSLQTKKWMKTVKRIHQTHLQQLVLEVICQTWFSHYHHYLHQQTKLMQKRKYTEKLIKTNVKKNPRTKDSYHQQIHCNLTFFCSVYWNKIISGWFYNFGAYGLYLRIWFVTLLYYFWVVLIFVRFN